jgi:hypothetical protein
MARPKGRLVILQQMGEMADGKIHFLAGVDENVFNLEDGDQFFTAIFTIDPFENQTDGNEKR